MPEQLLITIVEANPESLFILLALNVLRLLGFSYGFVPFSWAVSQSAILRMSISLALAGPIVVANLNATVDIAETTSRLYLALLLPKEFALGFGMGILASGPFRILQYAGALTDTFRGEDNNGFAGPDGSQLHTMAVAYLVAAFFFFATMGGFSQTAGLIYRSTLVWPVTETLPALSTMSPALLGELFDNAFKVVFLISAPVLTMLVFIELVCYGGAKLGRRMGFYEMAFPIKNLATMVSLPLIMYLLYQNIPSHLQPIFEVLGVTELFLP